MAKLPDENAREKLTVPYSRLNVILLRIIESQPMASAAMLKVLAQTIEQAQATIDAAQASVQEIQRAWNLL